jgi:hypothetical protein
VLLCNKEEAIPQVRYFQVPSSEELCKRIVNRNGNPIADLKRYQNRRIKRARRHDQKVVVTLESSFGVSGITLVFDSPELYESCVSRVFVSHPRPGGQASN